MIGHVLCYIELKNSFAGEENEELSKTNQRIWKNYNNILIYKVG